MSCLEGIDHPNFHILQRYTEALARVTRAEDSLLRATAESRDAEAAFSRAKYALEDVLLKRKRK